MRTGLAFTRTTAEDIPACILPGYVDTWTEAIEGCLDGEVVWGLLAQIRAKALLAPIPTNDDPNLEFKQRLQLWQKGDITGLVSRVEAQRVAKLENAKKGSGRARDEVEEQGKRTRKLTMQGAKTKAIKGLVGRPGGGNTRAKRRVG